MCLGCDCPQPLPPPNQKIAQCRKMLQGLAVGLLVLGVIGIISGMVFQFFYDLLLIYILFMSWTQFNWCMTMAFFLFCTIQTVQSIIVIIGLIQYGQLFTSKNNIMISIYCVLSVAYYPVAVYFSHFCYKNFKHSFEANGGMGFMNNRPGGAGGQVANNGGNYNRVRQDNQGQQPVFGQPVFNRNNNQGQNNDGNNYFRGEGVRIG